MLRKSAPPRERTVAQDFTRPRMLTGGSYERTSGAAGQPLRGGYQRRTPEHTVLHELVSRHA